MIDRRWRARSSAISASPADALDDVAALARAPEDEAPDELLDRARAITSVSRVVVQLPDELSDVYVARFVEGLAQRDAAARLGITRQRLRTLEQWLFDRVCGARASRPEGARAGVAHARWRARREVAPLIATTSGRSGRAGKPITSRVSSLPDTACQLQLDESNDRAQFAGRRY